MNSVRKTYFALRRFLFCNVTPLIHTGRLRPLDVSDFPEVELDLRASQTEQAFVGVSDSRPLHFVWKMFWNSGPGARRMVTLLFVRLPLSLLGPFLLNSLLNRMSHLYSGNIAAAVMLGLGLALTVILDGVVVQHYFYYGLRTYQRITSGLNMRVYRASLVLSRQAQMETSTGDLVNHLSSDTEGIAESAFFIPEITFGIFLFLGSCVILVKLLGQAAWVAIAFALILAPLTRFFARRFQKTDKALWKFRDERVTLMSQILTGIRLVKSYAWEKSLTAEVDSLRRKELDSSLELVRNEARSTLFSLGASLLMSTAAFAVFVLLGGHLTAAIIFPCVLVFQQIDMPLSNFPHWLKDIIHSRVAADRLDRYFKMERLIAPEAQAESKSPLGIEVDGISLKLKDKAVLTDVTLTIRSGESVAIVGAVGSGKSTLLLSLLGEANPQSGGVGFLDPNGAKIHRPDRIGWAPQEPFILNATVKENISIACSDLASLDLDLILSACALKEDLRALPAGLDTEIGERGVNLSGGQKQRLALARIAACDLGIYLLDDPLSAVDPKTEDVLIDHLFFGLWKDKTRVVTTHRLGSLHRFDRIVMMDEGRIVATGKLDELMNSSQQFKEFYRQHLLSASEAPLPKSTPVNQSAEPSDGLSSGVLISLEDRSVGAVPTRLYWDYFKSLGGREKSQVAWTLTRLIGISALVVALPIIQSRWIGMWADAQDSHIGSRLQSVPALVAVAISFTLGLTTLTMVFFERLGWMTQAIESSTEIHTQALHGVLSAPIRFFDTTPVGRVINRFARDLQGVDDQLSWNFRSTVGAVAAMLATLVMIVAVIPGLVLAIVPVLYVFYIIQRDYRRSAREAKRLESISRSPRFALFKETLSGLSVIRALGIEDRFLSKMTEHLEHYTRMYWGSILINRWFSTRVPVVSGVIALATSLSTIYLVSVGHMQPGLAGLLLTFSMSFWAQLNWSVRSFSEVESRMTSYERLRSFAAIEPELGIQTGVEAPANWPSKGAIVFKNVFATYSPELPDVLNGVDVEIPARAQVGIIGRTGSGKSSLIQALFRFLEIRSGSIQIDGVDIRSVDVGDLRRAFSIIPQDPILFIGTVRSNLDRFGKFTDEEIWRALRRVRMDERVLELGSLESAVAENGYNFSQGQRQLLCLARALLNQSRIIVLDEATASIDVHTDALIQIAIREEFGHATVLIIAHRPNSVAHCDWILQMEQGRASLRSRKSFTHIEMLPAEVVAD